MSWCSKFNSRSKNGKAHNTAKGTGLPTKSWVPGDMCGQKAHAGKNGNIVKVVLIPKKTFSPRRKRFIAQKLNSKFNVTSSKLNVDLFEVQFNSAALRRYLLRYARRYRTGCESKLNSIQCSIQTLQPRLKRSSVGWEN